MWTFGSLVHLFSIMFITTLVCSVCQVAVKPVLQQGDRFAIYRELLLSLQFLTRWEIPSTIPTEIFVPFPNHPRRLPRRKRGRKGGAELKSSVWMTGDGCPPSFQCSCRSDMKSRSAACLVLQRHGWTRGTWTTSWRSQDSAVPLDWASPVKWWKKPRRGRVLLCNKRYCKTIYVREQICTPDIELLSISLRPF